MRKQKLFCAAAILTVALSLPVYGGDVQTPTAPAPPPPVPTVRTNSTSEYPSVPADTSTGAQAVSGTSSDLFIEFLSAVLSIF